jgi:hypothetical protein
MKDYNFLQKKAIEYPRIAGILILLLGCFLFYECSIVPYYKILGQESDIRISMIGIICGFLLPLVGIIFLLFGNKYADLIFMHPSDIPPKHKTIFYVVSFIIGGGSLFWFL